MDYKQLIQELKDNANQKYKIFHSILLKNSVSVLGVNVPKLREISKNFISIYEVLDFPDDYYEVTFIKMLVVSREDYHTLVDVLPELLPLIDNWATCDCFAPKVISKNRQDFLCQIKEYIKIDKEFYQRFCLVMLLKFYVKEECYLEEIYNIIVQSNTSYYYVHMAVAWLIAEMLIFHYDNAVNFLLQNDLDKKTHNKAIQKAIESFRLTQEQKKFLRGIKR